MKPPSDTPRLVSTAQRAHRVSRQTTKAEIYMKLGTAILFLGVASHAGMAQSAGTFTLTGSMITPRTGHTATLLLTGRVLIAGGIPNDWPDVPLLDSAELYDPSTGTFAGTGNMTTGRAHHTATLLPDGRVLVTGTLADLSAETYDPATGSFTSAGNMVAHPYPGQANTLLQNGKVFIAAYPTAQLYDPITGTFAATGPYADPAPSIPERATLLADGRILLTGAVNICYQPQCADPGTGWTELYDPTEGTFRLAEGMKWWNTVYTATLLTSGKVLFEGNDNYNGIPSAGEIFDPSDGTFTGIHGLSPSPTYGAATLLPDGTVLITGGFLPGQAISELYMPASDTFSAAGSLITAGTSTLLPDGTVLIAGGSSAQLYQPAVLVSGPLLFFLSADGKGQGAIWHAGTGQVVSQGAPAAAGEILSMYTTSLIDGSVIPPQVAIGGRLAEILFFGNAPGYPGFNQVNFRVPAGIAPGSAVPVRLTYLGRPSNEVTIAVQ